jgi:mannose-1-phosphate guanylyltransferase
LTAADTLARRGCIVTFGVVPTKPETGYGYIEAGETVGAGLRVASFREKPDLETAREYLDAGNYFWNSGMFVFQLDIFRSELETHSGVVGRLVAESPELIGQDGSGVRTAWQAESLASLYEGVPSISVDYAVMERSDRMAVVPASFSWNDVGSWDEIAELGREQGVLAELESERNFVFSDLPVALCGVSDLRVIVKNGKVLICKRGNSQLVKTVAELDG